ncbi:MAG: DUF4214 domain-containing protein [Pseudomonadota bacterium]
MTVDPYAPSAADGLSVEELEFYELLSAYRVSLGLEPVPLSSSLTLTAGRHAADTLYNILAGEGFQDGTDAHSWSDAPYPADGSDPEVMWRAPERLGTEYAGAGFEAFEISLSPMEPAPGYAPTPAEALEAILSSEAHASVIGNTGAWEGLEFAAMGIGIERDPELGTVLHLWLGLQPDPAGPPQAPEGFSDFSGLEQPEDAGFGAEDAQNVALLYEVALNRRPELDGLNYWIDQHEGGLSLEAMGAFFTGSDEFIARFGEIDALSDGAYLALLYDNVLGRSGEAGGLSFWSDQLAAGQSRESVLVAFAQSPENRAASDYVLDLAQDGAGDWVFG